VNKNPIKIAFVGGRGIANYYSGIETYYEEVGSRLAKRGHQVVTYCRSYFTPHLSNYQGMTVRRLPSVRSKHFDTFVHSFISTLDALPRDLDIIHYHAIGSSLFSFIPRLVNCRTIVTVHALDWEREKWGHFATWFLKGCEMASAKFPTATTVVSKKLRNHYVQKYDKSPAYIPNGVVAPNFCEPSKIKEFGLAKNNFLLFAGRLSPEKGCHYMLEALKPLNTALKVVFAGGSSYSEEYIRRLRELAWDNVMFLGYVDRDTMAELYSNCYAFVLPSEIEGLSISLLEALSYGSCIVASDIEENMEAIEDAGLSFRSMDVSSLREVFKLILGNPALVESYRRKAQELGHRRFNWDEVTRQTEAFYYQVLSGKRNGS
jgi:glycosyltransferase involved in cell wall biosynthesis